MQKTAYEMLISEWSSDVCSFNLALDAGRLGAADVIDHAALKLAGLARGGKNGVRLLAKGELKTKLSFKVAGAFKESRTASCRISGCQYVSHPLDSFTTNKTVHTVHYSPVYHLTH